MAGHTDKLHGGKADSRKPEDFDPEQLAIGIKVEMEHTDDPDLAREIAMDHLTEFPNYYTALLKMEDELKDKAKKSLSGNVQVGPRGGRFYIAKNGDKIYVGADWTPGPTVPAEREMPISVGTQTTRPVTTEPRDPRLPVSGTVLHRSLPGQEDVVVKVTPTGFMFRGSEFSSLGTISEIVTGRVQPLSWWGLKRTLSRVEQFQAIPAAGVTNQVEITNAGLPVNQQPPYSSGVDFQPSDLRNYPVKSVSLEKLVATQPMVDKTKVMKFIADPGLGGDNLPVVVLAGGQYFIADGHHRATASMLRGEAYMKAHVVDVAAVSPAKIREIEAAGVIHGVKIPTGAEVVWASKNPEGNENGCVVIYRVGENLMREYSQKQADRSVLKKLQVQVALDKHWTEIYSRMRARMLGGADPDRQQFEVLGVIEATGMRVGNTVGIEEGAKQESYGATTLEKRHVTVLQGKVVFDFIGKHKVANHFEITDPAIVSAISRRWAAAPAPTSRLWPSVTDVSVRDSMVSLSPPGVRVTPKDLRTRIGNSVALDVMKSMDAPTTQKEKDKAKKAVAKAVAAALGNTPDVALSYYILPVVFDQWVVK